MSRTHFISFAPASVLALCALLIGCDQRPPQNELAGEIQGTTYHIKWISPDQAVDLDSVRAAVDATFARIDGKLSNWRDDSEISRINQTKTTDWIAISPELAELLDIARVVYEKSQGCYDLTVKPLFDLWGFAKHQNQVPTPQQIEAVLPHIGLDKLELDTSNLRLRKRDPELAIDLSSIAQGYTVGAVARYLESMGIQNYLAEVGGEMKVKGRKADGDTWRVAVEKPTPFSREVQKILEIQEQNGVAIMTSGTYRNFFEQDGHNYSHILDPKTGRPVTHHLLSTTVLHPDPTWADAWSTALLCLGEERGSALADAEGLRVLFISGEQGALREQTSKTWAQIPSP